MATFEEVLAAIRRERAYQDGKWGRVDEHGHDVAGWLVIMAGELEEAMQGWRKGAGDFDALKEILQLAAVAVACLEQHGIVERPDIAIHRRIAPRPKVWDIDPPRECGECGSTTHG